MPDNSASSSLARTFALATIAALSVSACSSSDSPSSSSDANATQPDTLTPEILAEHPWDSSTFTQGLEMAEDGTLVVGSGLYGESRIYRSTLDGKQSHSHDLPDDMFGEGLTIHDQTVWQLTWKKGTALRREAKDLKQTSTATYEGEGWGLCSDGKRLIMSDGSGRLTFRDPESFAPTGSVDVTLGGEATDELNELECTDDGKVLANVWQQDVIYQIDPDKGEATGVIDTAGAFDAKERAGADVLNGIAQIPGTDRYLLTGKQWDTMYEVRFRPAVS